MGKELKTYYDFATNDYECLMDAYRAGFVSNAMGAMAQGICEKYLKHVINEYVLPETAEDAIKKTEALRTHNLDRLSKFLAVYLPELKIDRKSLKTVNGLYFTTRYPGDESIVVEKEDLDEYVEAVEKCRKEIDSFVSYHTGERHE